MTNHDGRTGSFRLRPIERARAKTSEDILRENTVLRERLRKAESLLSVIALEADLAIEHPNIALLIACRVGALARQIVDGKRATPESETRDVAS